MDQQWNADWGIHHVLRQKERKGKQIIIPGLVLSVNDLTRPLKDQFIIYGMSELTMFLCTVRMCRCIKSLRWKPLPQM